MSEVRVGRVRRHSVSPGWYGKEGKVGEEGVCTKSEDYVPGWDAGQAFIDSDSGERYNYWGPADAAREWENI